MRSASCSAPPAPSPSARSCPASTSSTRPPPTTAACTRRWAPRASWACRSPSSYGGAGMDYIAFALLCEEMERADTAFRVILSVHTGLNSLTLLQWGSEEQKQHYLAPQARGEKLATFGLTEPGVGLGRRQPGDHCAPRRRPLHPERQQDLDQPGRHRRPLPGLRHGRSQPRGTRASPPSSSSASFPGFSSDSLHGKLGVRAGNTGHPVLQRLRGAGGQPGRRGGRGLHHRHERHRPGPLHRCGRIGRAWRRPAWTHRSSTRTSARRSARRSASTSWSSR